MQDRGNTGVHSQELNSILCRSWEQLCPTGVAHCEEMVKEKVCSMMTGVDTWMQLAGKSVQQQ